MIPHYPEFKPLSLDDKALLLRHLRQTSREICELSLGNLFIWQEFDRPQVTCINRNTCLLIDPPNEPAYFLEPLGRHELPATVRTMFRHIGRISRVSPGFASLLPPAEFALAPLRNQFDYLYLRQEIAELKGRKFDGKRNHLKRFQAKHPDYQFVPLTVGYKNEALALFEKWFKIREESRYFPRLAYISQKGAINAAFTLFDRLKLLGGVLLVDDQFQGFTLGSQINPETVSVHFLYVDPELPGGFPAVLWAACNNCYRGFKYIDLEQDLGIPGLRQAKLSYQPHQLVEKYEVKRL
ncbi:MAG: phosphatidylglycerol lysyltransferase domain-containing protein [Candidatus Margulisbacteria bacterium]|nr:phosphatidylglycerol lysyltransferase domain-containing protein [Candidatus Margulisiibacteriota bacterium]